MSAVFLPIELSAATVCPICKEDLQEGAVAHEKLGMRHPMHATCLKAWLNFQNYCPVCFQNTKALERKWVFSPAAFGVLAAVCVVKIFGEDLAPPSLMQMIAAFVAGVAVTAISKIAKAQMGSITSVVVLLYLTEFSQERP